MAMLCWATYAGTPQKRIVGLCHSVQNTSEELAELVGVPCEEITFLGAGVNHQAFILRFERDGENLYPLLDAGDRARPRADAPGPGRRSTGGSATSRPSRASTGRVPPLAPARRRRDRALPASGSPSTYARSEENLDEYEQTKASARRRPARSTTSRATSTRRRSSTRSRRASRGSSTATSATRA